MGSVAWNFIMICDFITGIKFEQKQGDENLCRPELCSNTTKTIKFENISALFDVCLFKQTHHIEHSKQ